MLTFPIQYHSIQLGWQGIAGSQAPFQLFQRQQERQEWHEKIALQTSWLAILKFASDVSEISLIFFISKP